MNRRDVSGRQSIPLTDLGVRVGRGDGVLPVGRESGSRVVHDRAVVVGAQVVAVDDVLVELRRHAGLDVLPVDRHEKVAVLAALLVPETDRVADLVDRVARRAAGAQADVLAPASHPDERPAPTRIREVDVVRELGGIRRCTEREAEGRVRLPVCDRVRHARLVGQGGIDLIRNLAVRPPELASGDADPKGDDARIRCNGLARGRSRLLYLLDGPERDVAFENRDAVDVVVRDRAEPERVAADDGGPQLFPKVIHHGCRIMQESGNKRL